MRRAALIFIICLVSASCAPRPAQQASVSVETTRSVYLKNPFTGQIAECGPYPAGKSPLEQEAPLADLPTLEKIGLILQNFGDGVAGRQSATDRRIEQLQRAWEGRRAEAARREERCIADFQRQGYVRLPAASEQHPVASAFLPGTPTPSPQTRAGAFAGVKKVFPTNPVPVTFARAGPDPDNVVVIIANANYGAQGRGIPDVTPAYADAEGFKRFAVQALGVREANILHLKDATQADLVSTFGNETSYKAELYNWIVPGQSNVYVYYAGHGAPAGEHGGSYLVPSDARGSLLEFSGYALKTLYQNLSKLPAKSVTVVLEACFSGVSQSGAVVRQASPIYLRPKAPEVPPNLTVITAGTSNQMASWEQDSSHSLFTKYFLLGLSGQADAAPYGNGDGQVYYDELDRYLKSTVKRLARRYYGRDQTPQIIVGKGG